jgi:glycosyltransferase involved in cell wall biosynthesis
MAPDRDEARRSGRRSLGIAGEEILLAYFGFMYPGKGVETLLRAFAIVAARHDSVRLVLIGGTMDLKFGDRGAYADDLQQLCDSLGIGARVVWTGGYDTGSPRASRYLYAADVCVFPHDLGIQLNNSSLAAALAHSLPVVATRSESLEAPFLDGRNVLLCPRQDPSAMACCIERVIEDRELRRRLASGSAELAAAWFSWDRAVALTVAALQGEPADPSLYSA